jgi:hydroxymethylbilane synthase
MNRVIRIGTRESQLALWQANEVKRLLEEGGHATELVLIKSEGDIDLSTPLYELGVQGIFTKALDIALLNNTIDIAVHSMKDVPTQLAKGISEAAVLPRASYKDLFVPKQGFELTDDTISATIATSSIRRRAQWLNKFPNHRIESLRGNVNTRLRKIEENDWNGAIFAAAGLERIDLRPANAVELDWMLPAPAQGAIVVVCRSEDEDVLKACKPFNDEHTALCTKIERDFLRQLMGGCTTPISGLAQVVDGDVVFKGNVLSADGSKKVEIERSAPLTSASELGRTSALEIIAKGAEDILAEFKK